MILPLLHHRRPRHDPAGWESAYPPPGSPYIPYMSPPTARADDRLGWVGDPPTNVAAYPMPLHYGDLPRGEPARGGRQTLPCSPGCKQHLGRPRRRRARGPPLTLQPRVRASSGGGGDEQDHRPPVGETAYPIHLPPTRRNRAPPERVPLLCPHPRKPQVRSEKSRRRRAYPQQIVTTRLLYCLQDPFAQLSRLQRI